MILDSRGERRDRQDRQLLSRLQAEQVLDRAVTYTHRGLRDELLLCLPDAFGWAWGAGGLWRRQVEPLITVVKVR
ncbi:MAG: hypothetical protein M3063_16505 [Actinomycetota bacterium]|nr:hypothetical protein [Actinomycetota bacterium]